ncbi:NAD-dependent epimerase [Pedobacter sandarakinus]|uniref:NAD-dependent epimerase n=1 Tax=Pedobacter sandarakinus TaxID=353156 RepID=UPI002246738B|nr:NAD-dependent epimerase [Pedobacter sandarakinus]MCX2574307.1 NAD-dependent epimerase [Pedobacter sandarakinus]
MKILITGTAGFIGFHLAKRLLERGDTVVGIDNINDYYDVNLKHARLNQTGINHHNLAYGIPQQSSVYGNYTFIKVDICDKDALEHCFKTYQFDAVCNLAAQAGVRYSLTNPDAYIEANIKGFLNVLECSRHHKIGHLLYASSSSVYGLNKSMPFSAHDNVDHPVSLYAASKKSNELMAHAYSHLFNLPTTALRFFTVYGPWGRPDMALFLFTKAILDGKPIEVFNNGEMRRDFTYIDDIVEGIVRVFDNPATANHSWDAQNPDPATSKAPFAVFNIGRGTPVKLLDFVEEIENETGISAQKVFMPMQDGDVAETAADIEDLKGKLGYQPIVSVQQGVKNFVNWFTTFYNYQSKNDVITHKIAV